MNKESPTSAKSPSRVRNQQAGERRAVIANVLGALARTVPALPSDDVQDLIQQVAERVQGKIDAGPDVRDPVRYAKQAARNAFYGHLRRRGVQLVLERRRQDGTDRGLDPWIDRIGDRLGMHASPSELVIGRDDADRHRRLILGALQRLPDKQRTVLLLRFGEGLTPEEVAKKLGYKNAIVVNTLAARARRSLAQLLSPSLAIWVEGGGR